MAKKGSQENVSSTVITKPFTKGMNKDVDTTFLPEGYWTHARNLQNNTVTGDVGTLSNEPANFLCGAAPYPIIGTTHLFGDKWIIYSTDNTNSEIGLYDESDCCYLRIVNDSCLEFKKENLILGVSRENADCTWSIYWADGLNPDRVMNIGNPTLWPQNCIAPLTLWDGPPWKQQCTTVNGCTTCINLPDLDCDKLRLASLMETPCVKVRQGPGGGNLQAGSYYAVIAYCINGQKVTDYFSPSNVQVLFDRDAEFAGSLEIEVEADTEYFSEYELVIVSNVSQQTVAKRIGIYSTRQTIVSLDIIASELTSVPIDNIPLRNNVYEKSEGMFEVNRYLLRIRPTGKLDFNYQPLANLIGAKWVSVEYPATYYQNGGFRTSYLRDEVYSFFIRWIYDTGDKSQSYHIPGRFSNGLFDLPTVSNADAAQNIAEGIGNQTWQVYNTAVINTAPGSTKSIDDAPYQGTIIAEGDMSYWESTEIYPDDKPEIWNSSSQPWTGVFNQTNPSYDLCGKKIRHHKFPENYQYTPNGYLTRGELVHFRVDPVTGDQFIRIMGVRFQNIALPKDNDGDDITNIVGYEILRGTRQGNRSIIAKGLINNMRKYEVKDLSGANVIDEVLYQNYPFNDLNPDPFLNITPNQPVQNVPISLQYLSFHSPDTNFNRPYLNTKQLKLYNNIYGNSTHYFQEPEDHPQFKLIKDVFVLFALMAGAAYGIIKLNGKKQRTYSSPRGLNIGFPTTLNGTTSPVTLVLLPPPGAHVALATTTQATSGNTASSSSGAIVQAGAPGGQSSVSQAAQTQANGPLPGTGAASAPGFIGGEYTESYESTPYDGFPLGVGGVYNFLYFFSEGVETAMRAIYAFTPYRQYALQSLAHGFYDSSVRPIIPNVTREIDFNAYVRPGLVNFDQDYKINNIKRNTFVGIKTLVNAQSSAFLVPPNSDNSYAKPASFSDPRQEFQRNISSWYAGIKVRIQNQYGQLDSIKQIPITDCEQKIDFSSLISNSFTVNGKQYTKRVIPSGINFNSPSPPACIFFGGDTYIQRYTEKTTFFYFNDWLYGQPDGFEYNYYNYRMVSKPKFWVNSKQFTLSGAVNSAINSLITLQPPSPSTGAGILPSDFYKLDDGGFSSPLSAFTNDNTYFYLFNSGVRDFFVETERLSEFREQGVLNKDKFYDPYGFNDLGTMFNANPDVIPFDNFYAYDESFSISRLFNNFISWGQLQARNYDPQVSQLCYQYFPYRILYSLPQQDEQIRDSWRIYLANNYKDYRNYVTGVKSISRNGAMFFFRDSSPVLFQGVDELKTDLGTKVTLGDGALFSQAEQRIVNAENSFEYASCQDIRSVISTPGGLFWTSQNQGKIYQYTGQLKEISLAGLKWWFFKYMQYELLKDFPNFPLVANPVAGVGMQTIYENVDTILYICKKDYYLRDQYKNTGRVIYDESTNEFVIDRLIRVKIGDANFFNYFDDASWTVSYDLKNEMWISFHDWKPDLLLPSKNHFSSIKGSGIWRHNNTCAQYCNFYGVDYPFEIEIPVASGQQVFTLRSLEYTVESFVARNLNNCTDDFQILDYNFDEAIIWNTEQTSGLLRLNLQSKNNGIANLAYPIINPGFIDILYAKEEQKIRFNQFWDITDDRGEFNPIAQRQIWNTQPNGYLKTLNPNNLNYNKLQTQRKKFRHYINYVLLRKRVSGNVNMILRSFNEKLQFSSR